MKKLWVVIPALMIGAFAGAAEIATETTENGVKTRWSVTSISADNLMRIDEGSWGGSSTMSDEASAGGSADVTYFQSSADDTTIYDPHLEEIMSVEGNICRVLSKDSAAPPGMEFMGGADMQEHQRKMAEAFKGADAQIAGAIEQARQGGASQAQLDMMNAMLGGLGQAPVETDDTLHVVSLDRTETVGDYQTEVFLATTAAGVDKYRLYMVDIDRVPGGRSVKDGMIGMVNLYGEYMEGINAGALMDESLTTVLTSPDFADSYPAGWFDVETGTLTAITKASAAPSNADFGPDCTKKDMMSP